MNQQDLLEQEEEPAPQLDAALVSQAVVASTDWTTETLINQLRRGNIALNPRFQRRDAWGTDRKSRFVESIILGLPIPQVVLAERAGQKGTYIVLDGKQRLLSMMQFAGIAAEGSKNNKFSLEDLEVRDDLNGKTYADIEHDLGLMQTLNAFHNQTIRSVVIRNWPNMAFLHMVFLRLNTGSVTLSPQELRQAMFPGPFSDFLDDTASASTSLQELLELDEPDFRMRDVELLARFLAFANFVGKYAGELKPFIDEACSQLNVEWFSREAVLKSQAAAFELALTAGLQIFGRENLARRPGGMGKRRPFNRAILDTILFYFSDQQVRDLAVAKPGEVRAAYETLYKSNLEFARASESSTKTVAATYARYRLWGEALRAAVGAQFILPELQNNRILFAGFWP